MENLNLLENLIEKIDVDEHDGKIWLDLKNGATITLKENRVNIHTLKMNEECVASIFIYDGNDIKIKNYTETNFSVIEVKKDGGGW